MQVPRLVRRIAKPIVRAPPVAACLRALLRPMARRLPFWVLERIPVRGTVTARLPRSGRELLLATDGEDPIAAQVYWLSLMGFEPATMRVLFPLLQAAEVFLDVGANVGLYALVAALDDPARQVYAFEPVPRVFERLRRNLELNALANVRAYPYAVGATDGPLTLYVPTSAVPVAASSRQGLRSDVESISVPSVTLDSFVKREGLGRVDLIKMDTETTEPELLCGARALLGRDEPSLLCEVWPGRTEAALHQVLDPFGYRYLHLTLGGVVERQRIAGDPSYRDLNYLFVGPRRYEALRPLLGLA